MKQIGEAECGFCTWSIENQERYIGEKKEHQLDGEPWSKIKKDAVVLPIKSWVRVKTYIIENCKKNNDCNSEIDKWRIKLDSLDSIGEGFPKP